MAGKGGKRREERREEAGSEMGLGTDCYKKGLFVRWEDGRQNVMRLLCWVLLKFLMIF